MALGGFACDDTSTGGSLPGPSIEIKVPQPDVLPEYSIPDALEAAHPEVAKFIERFLQTCLVGDYSGYRLLVSRLREPITPARFEAMYNAVTRVEVRAIEPMEVRDIPSPTYRVVVYAEVDPAKAAGREITQSIALLVFPEAGEWRLIPAPRAMQPGQDEEASATTQPSEPITTRPAFPWDEDGDF